MTPLFDTQEYYKKMLELQEKLRKSEEDRIRLEERFNLLEQESRLRHETCINKLRMRYIEFLEEQRLRDERNNKLLGALDKVDTSLALMSAKTDKLCTLRKEYEASILRAYASRRQAPSITGDSGIVSHNEERRFRKYPPSSSSFPSASSTSLHNLNFPMRNYEQPSTSNFYSKPLFYPQRPIINYPEPFQPKLIRDLETTWGHSTPRVDTDAFRRNPRYLPKENLPFPYPETIRSPKTSKLTSILTNSNVKEEKTGNVVENELEKYITKIRSLHGDLDQSLEEIDHEQNTSGDILNVTLSDDGFDHLPPEEKPKGQIPVEITKVLEIAEDLASRTIEENVKNPLDEKPKDLEISRDNSTPINEKHLEAKQLDEIKSITKDTEIEQPEIITKIQSEVISAPVQMNTNDLDDIATNIKNAEEFGKEVINDFSVAEELEPWSIKNLEARVEEIFINNENTDIDNSKNVSETSDADEINSEEKIKVEDDKVTDKTQPENVNFVNEKEDEKNEIVYETNYQNDNIEQIGDYNQNVDQNYGELAGNYDYNNPENYQYTDDQQYQYNQDYNYNENNGENQNLHYQNENYDPNAQYDENYVQDPNAQYPVDNYQYQGQYHVDQNQEYDPQHYGYNYEQNEEYQGQNYEQYQQHEIPENQQLQHEVPENQQLQHDILENQQQQHEILENQQKQHEISENQQHEISENQPQHEISENQQQHEISENQQQQEIFNEEIDNSTANSNIKEKDKIMEINKKKDVIKSLLDSETESSIEKNTSNTESDFDFN